MRDRARWTSAERRKFYVWQWRAMVYGGHKIKGGWALTKWGAHRRASAVFHRVDRKAATEERVRLRGINTRHTRDVR